MVGKYLEIFDLEVGESTSLFRTNWEMSLTYSLKIICGQYLKSSKGERRVSHVSHF